jgi:Skp family chaperone for outer membrane proteins
MKRLHWNIVVAVAALAVVLVGANGLKQGPTKVAVCEIRRVLVEYQRFVDMRTTMETMQKDAQAELEKRRAEIEGYSAQRSELNPGSPDDVKLQDLMFQKSVEAQAFGEITKGRMERKQYDEIKACYEDMLKAMEDVARQHGIDVVLSKRDINIAEARSSKDLESLIAAKYVLHNVKGIDITDAVLEHLNTKYKQ